MTDSFFSSENSFDLQMQKQEFTALSSQEMIEAGVRRLVELEGPVSTAQRLYRLADICAAADAGAEGALEKVILKVADRGGDPDGQTA